jgi:hypothetical protein
MGPEAGRVRLPRPGGHGPHGLRVVVDGGVRVSAAQRERLLDATLTAVDELGYRQTTVRVLARRAGISQRVGRKECSDPALMAMIVLPYRGRAAAGRELRRSTLRGEQPNTPLIAEDEA